MTQEALVDQSTSIISQYLTMISDPTILIPLVFTWGAGYIFSQSRIITRMTAQSDKNFWVYLFDAAIAAILFTLVCTAPKGMQGLTTLLVSGVAVAFPYIYFEIIKKKKD